MKASARAPLNLNADMGESFGAWTMGNDEALLDIVGSANLACGFHAGDPEVMRATVRLALSRGVSIGAHPGYPDLQGFGRRPMQMTPQAIEAMVLYQIGALQALAAAEGGAVSHVKPHGALSNAASANPVVAGAIVRAVAMLSKGSAPLILLAPALSVLHDVAAAAGLPVAAEIFADRAYAEDGQLAPRSEPGAVLHAADDCLQHMQAMLAAGGIVTRSGRVLPTPIQSICVHGDSPSAVATAQLLAQQLRSDGHRLVPLPALVRR